MTNNMQVIWGQTIMKGHPAIQCEAVSERNRRLAELYPYGHPKWAKTHPAFSSTFSPDKHSSTQLNDSLDDHVAQAKLASTLPSHDLTIFPTTETDPVRQTPTRTTSEPQLPMRSKLTKEARKARDSGKLGGEQFYNFSLVHLRPGVGRKTR